RPRTTKRAPPCGPGPGYNRSPSPRRAPVEGRVGLSPAGGEIVSMGNVTVIGGQWGDEGKGKVIDWLANRAEVVVRFQGGNNAGHTIVVGNSTYKLSLLPSGVVQGKLSIIGNGVVVDPWALLDEIERAKAQGLALSPEVLVVA